MEVTCPTCGVPFNFKGGPAHFKRTFLHYCSRDCQNVRHGMSRRKEPSKRYDVFHTAKKRARLKGTPFSLVLDDMPEIPEFCPVLGIRIESNTSSGPIDSSPSLDRINPLLGYVKGNVRFISNRANRIKADATLTELKLIVADAENIK